jgi:hypothetical protein
MEDLSLNWHVMHQYSSWIKFKREWCENILTGTKHKREHTDSNQVKENVEFAQMNFIVCLNMPSDNLIHLLPFAHVNYHKVNKSDINKGGGHISLDLNPENFPSKSYFTCLTAIFSTNIATSIFNSDKFPLVKKMSYAANNSRTVLMPKDGTAEYILKNNNPLNHRAQRIYFLELTPYREKIAYPSIEKRKLIKNDSLSDCIVIYN